jgi:hypothetical protein
MWGSGLFTQFAGDRIEPLQNGSGQLADVGLANCPELKSAIG